MAKLDNRFTIKLSDFYQGYAPLAHLNALTQFGNAGNASAMTSCDIITSPDYLTQGPGLADLTAGTQAGAITENLAFILDRAVTSDVTYAIGTTKLQKLSSSAVTNAGIWPHAITNCTDGSSVIEMGGNLYYFYNKSSGGDVGKFDLSTAFDDDWGSEEEVNGGPVGHSALQSAIHPSACKEDRMVFGNGRYLGLYINGGTFYPTKLDFGTGRVVADVVFSANQWWVAVNTGITGTNRDYSQIYLWDGAGLSSILSDEVAVGLQRIGFIYVQNGIIWVAYQDLSSAGGFKIGYVSGRELKEVKYFTGTLPTFAQKTLYQNTILFPSSGAIMSFGAVVESLPLQISNLADGGYANIGAISAPFGTPMIASNDGANYRLAKFSGYDTVCSWKSIIIPTVGSKAKVYIDSITVLTNALGANARCDLTLSYNQAVSASSAFAIMTTGKTKHFFTPHISGVEDLRINLDWTNGNSTNSCKIREILIDGHYFGKL